MGGINLKILVTGFDPFGGEKINPAYEAVRALESEINGCSIISREIPTVFGRSIELLGKTIEEIKPDIVICVGQAGGRAKITVERIAMNICDARIPDNEGNQPIGEAIHKDGSDGYFSNLPINRMARMMNDNNIPAEVSNTAGTYVCNYLMYGLMHLIKTKYKNIRGGFIHVPYINEQVLDKKDVPSMNLADVTLGLKYAIIGAIDPSSDDKVIGGEIS